MNFIKKLFSSKDEEKRENNRTIEMPMDIGNGKTETFIIPASGKHECFEKGGSVLLGKPITKASTKKYFF
jgi:hypothetical protein